MIGAGRILIADDETVFSQTAAELLSLRGYVCECVSTGDEAAEKLRHNRYDLLISDIKMPGNADLELIGQIRELAGGMPVILVTGHPSVRTAVEAFRLPVIDYLLKPVDFDDLLVIVEKSVAESKLRSQAAEAKQSLDRWCGDLHGFRSLLDDSGECTSESVNAFVKLNLKSVADTLVSFGRLMDDLTHDRCEHDSWELIASAQLDIAFNALTETIRGLKETKQLVKSKRLAKLRHKLQVIVDEWPRRPSGQSAGAGADKTERPSRPELVSG